jgi:NAD(P)H-hydrate epimerase
MTVRAVTAAEMREIDRRAIEEFGIPSYELMEKAGQAVAEEAAKLAGSPPKKILVFAGKGNNGGDGLAAARYLKQKGYPVQVLLFSEGQKLKADPARNFVENAKLNIPTRVVGEHFAWDTVPELFRDSDVVIDALFGVGLGKEIGEPYRGLIQRVNDSQKKVVSVDIPSGLDSDTGEILGTCVRAAVTVTMGLPKKGFYEGKGPEVTGKIVVADIGIPEELLK